MATGQSGLDDPSVASTFSNDSRLSSRRLKLSTIAHDKNILICGVLSLVYMQSCRHGLYLILMGGHLYSCNHTKEHVPRSLISMAYCLLERGAWTVERGAVGIILLQIHMGMSHVTQDWFRKCQVLWEALKQPQAWGKTWTSTSLNDQSNPKGHSEWSRKSPVNWSSTYLSPGLG